jgi:predicted RNA-binding protein
MEFQRLTNILENKLINYWMVVGSPANWKEAFEKGNIWGLRQRQKHRWETLAENDIILFYATNPIAGLIGYGSVQTKFRQDQPLWSEEIKEGKIIWPLRFEFNVDYCLPPDTWEADKITSDTLKLRVSIGFQSIKPHLAEQIISQLKQVGIKQPEETLSHKELQQKLIQIGKLQKYLAEGEYSFDIGRLDVVWRRIERSVPTYVFEIQIGGDIYHALAKLKHAFDLWNSRLFLIASQADHDKATSLLSGSFHEISDRVRFIELEKVEELYKRKMAFIDLEKELGI